MKVRAVLDSILLNSPAQPILKARSADRLVVLAYHDIQDPRQFRIQMEFVAAEMRPLSLDEMLDVMVETRGDPPEGAVLITFDDADRTLLDHGLPVLKRLGIPAVAFVIAGYLGTSRPFWWREVEQLIGSGASTPVLNIPAEGVVPHLKRMSDPMRRQTIRTLRQSAPRMRPQEKQLIATDLRLLHDEGIEIGNHTMTHPILDRCSARRIRSEIVRAHHALQEALGEEPVAFAYPNGNCDQEAIRVLSELGYRAGFLFDHQTAEIPPPDPFRISRVRVGSHTSLDRFRLIVSGLHPMIHRVLGRS